MDRLLVTIDESAAALSVSRRTIYRLIDAGKLEAINIGGCRRIPVTSLHKLCRTLTREARLDAFRGRP